jgi:hypothetical protein
MSADFIAIPPASPRGTAAPLETSRGRTSATDLQSITRQRLTADVGSFFSATQLDEGGLRARGRADEAGVMDDAFA